MIIKQNKGSGFNIKTVEKWMKKSIPLSFVNSLKGFAALKFQSSLQSTFTQAGDPREAHTDELTQGSSRATGTTEQYGS